MDPAAAIASWSELWLVKRSFVSTLMDAVTHAASCFKWWFAWIILNPHDFLVLLPAQGNIICPAKNMCKSSILLRAGAWRYTFVSHALRLILQRFATSLILSDSPTMLILSHFLLLMRDSSFLSGFRTLGILSVYRSLRGTSERLFCSLFGPVITSASPSPSGPALSLGAEVRN